MKEDFYKNLKSELDKVYSWPAVYIFKFVVPNQVENVNAIKKLLGEEAEYSYHFSSGDKYVSVTIKEVMLSADEIITIYKKAGEIKGIISL